MKRLFCLVLMSAFIFISTTAGAIADAKPAGSVTFMVGDVTIMGADNQWHPVQIGTPIFQGVSMRTGADSSCEITLTDSSIIRMDQNTEQLIEVADFLGERKVSLFSRAGRLWLNARKIIGKNDNFSVRSDKAVCAVRGTVFRVDTVEDQTQIAVYQGKVATWNAMPSPQIKLGPPHPVEGPKPVSMERWVQIVAELQQITVDRQGQYKRADLDLAKEEEDPWIKWNRNRDHLIIK